MTMIMHDVVTRTWENKRHMAMEMVMMRRDEMRRDETLKGGELNQGERPK